MKDFLIKILFITYVIVELLLGAMRVGGVSPRIVITLIMFVICAINGYIKFDKYVKIFLIFLVFFILSGLITGYTIETLKYCVSWYFAAFVVYQSTKMMICKFDDARLVIYVLLAIGAVDAVVTIGQYLGNPVALAIGSFSVNDEETAEYMLARIERRGDLVGMALPGIMGPVANGVFLSVFCVLSFYSSTQKLRIYNIALLLLGLVASFVTQERTGTAVACVFAAYLLFKNFRKNGGVKLVLVLVVVFLIALPYIWPIIENIVFGEGSRYGTIDSGVEVRQILGNRVAEFMSGHPLGGYFAYMDFSQKAPHNLIYNIFVLGGLIGGMAMIVLYIKQCALMARNFFRLNVKTDSTAILLILAYGATILNSLTHNCSFVRGDSICWMLFAGVVALCEEYNYNKTRVYVES